MCFPNLKIILRSRPSIFKFHLMRATNFLQIQLQNTCWTSPKPDIQRKNALVPHLNGRWISKFSWEKFVSEKSALIHLISHQTGPITSGFEGKNRNYQFLKNRVTLWYALSRTFSKKRKHPFRFFLEILLKSTENRKECFLKISASLWYAFYKPSSNLENHMTVCMEYPAKRPYEDEPENAAGRGQEIHAERTA